MKRWVIYLVLSMSFFLSFVVKAKEYQWQSIRFEHSDSWSILTNRTIKGAKVVRLNHKVVDSYPLSIMFSFIPKSSLYAENFSLDHGVSANVIATNFSWPLVQRFSKETSKDNLLVSFNEVLVGKTLSPGAMMMVPTPQKRIFISAQTFYLEKSNYYIVGSIISRIDKGIMRHSTDYAKRIDSAYSILKSLSVDFD